MQKLLSIPLLVLYLAVSVGFQGVHHFCGGDLVDVAFFAKNQEDDCGTMSCCENSSPADDECCTDIEFAIFYESERSLTLVSNGFELKAPDQINTHFFPLLLEETEVTEAFTEPLASPDPPSSVPIYLQHHSLIFYG